MGNVWVCEASHICKTLRDSVLGRRNGTYNNLRQE